jgi:hypothetical protein
MTDSAAWHDLNAVARAVYCEMAKHVTVNADQALVAELVLTGKGCYKGVDNRLRLHLLTPFLLGFHVSLLIT